MTENTDSDTKINEKIKKEIERINHMKKNQLVEQLKLRNLDTEGVKKVLDKRLKRHVIRKYKNPSHNDDPVYKVYENYKTQSLVNSNDISYYIVIDFEATCCKDQSKAFKQEIIEFPAVMVDARKMAVTKEFHSYVKPVLNPILTDYCTELTGIKQKTVDDAPEFPEVLNQFEKWMCDNQCGKKNCVIVTDGNWDMSKFMYAQCRWSQILLPWWSRLWMDIRQVFKVFYKLKIVFLASMLRHLSMTFQGRQHSGIDDSRNIARVLIRLMHDGCTKLGSNQQIGGYKISRNKRMLRKAMEDEEGWSQDEVEGTNEEFTNLQIN